MLVNNFLTLGKECLMDLHAKSTHGMPGLHIRLAQGGQESKKTEEARRQPRGGKSGSLLEELADHKEAKNSEQQPKDLQQLLAKRGVLLMCQTHAGPPEPSLHRYNLRLPFHGTHFLQGLRGHRRSYKE